MEPTPGTKIVERQRENDCTLLMRSAQLQYGPDQDRAVLPNEGLRAQLYSLGVALARMLLLPVTRTSLQVILTTHATRPGT